MADRIGQQLGNYRLTHLLGRGGFAEVYLGEHLRLHTQAAVKVLYTRLANHHEVEGFEKEAQIIAHLRHPHIVRILDYDVEDNTPFLVMDYAPGSNLRKRHPKGTTLPLTTIISYVKQIADALQYAHDQRFIHRDVKPENLLVGEHNELLLSDFGIAIVAQSSRYQSTQNMGGTMAYIAPEQIQGHPRTASDQYSLGIVVYEWLSGDSPFHGSMTEIVAQHLAALPPPLHEKEPTISSAVEQVVLKALEKDPYRRFESMKGFALALEQASSTIDSDQPYINALTDVLPPSIEPIIHPLATTNVSITQNQESPSASPLVVPSQVSSHFLSETTSNHHRSSSFITTASATPISLPVSPPKRGISRGRIVLLIWLLLIVVVSSTGIYYLARTNQRSTAGSYAATETAILGDTSTADVQKTRDTTQASASPTASTVQIKQNLYTRITSMTPTLSDQLSDNSNGIWDGVGQCSFISGAFHVNTVASASTSSCRSQNPIVGQYYAFQVQMTFVKGGTRGIYGGFFLLNGDQQYYSKAILIGIDGSYAFSGVLGNPGSNPPTIPSVTTSHTSTLHEGMGQANQITVIVGYGLVDALAPSNNIDLYINGQYVASDTPGISFPSNFLIFFASSVTSALVEVAYSHAKLWSNI